MVRVSKSFLVDCGELVLIDIGHSRGCSGNVFRALRGLGREPQEIALCVLTHRHRDHVGGLRALKELCGFEVASHATEAEAIEEATGVTVDHKLEDGDVMQRCGGIRVIHVPGHTHGNFCLLMDGSLFAGDTLFGGNGGLRPPPSRFSSDPGEALGGISKLEAFDFEAVYLSHGDDVLSGGKERL
ncbi:MAG: MBL fold metallo-hydrolase, partial [Candidatus Bathyarchaeota archaeon]|nr:MBL fold metallo-hydrolase [Candidatus Bathyarchaeota archaeon]